MIRLVALLALSAPFQCASDPDPNHRLEDTPSEALWNLAERFETAGETRARNTTLRQLIDQYPGSREARQARQMLAESGESETSAEGHTGLDEHAAPEQHAEPEQHAAPEQHANE